MANQAAPRCPQKPRIIEFPTADLSAEDSRAVDLLLLGHSATKVARMLGIDRKTLWRRRQNPHMQAEMNRRQHEEMEASQRRLRSLTEKATAVIEQHLAEGNLQAATALLKIVHNMPCPDMEADSRKLLKRQAEAMALDFYMDGPFTEKCQERSVFEHKGFREMAKTIHDSLEKKYGMSGAGEVEILVGEYYGK